MNRISEPCGLCGRPAEGDDAVMVTVGTGPAEVYFAVHRRHRQKQVPVAVPVPNDGSGSWSTATSFITEARTDLELLELRDMFDAGELKPDWDPE